MKTILASLLLCSLCNGLPVVDEVMQKKTLKDLNAIDLNSMQATLLDALRTKIQPIAESLTKMNVDGEINNMHDLSEDTKTFMRKTVEWARDINEYLGRSDANILTVGQKAVDFLSYFFTLPTNVKTELLTKFPMMAALQTEIGRALFGGGQPVGGSVKPTDSNNNNNNINGGDGKDFEGGAPADTQPINPANTPATDDIEPMAEVKKVDEEKSKQKAVDPIDELD